MMTITKEQAESRLGFLCRQLKLPAVARDGARCAVEGVRQGQDPLVYLVQLLEVELQERRERRAARRIKEAGFPMVKTIESFCFDQARHLPETRIRRLLHGDYIKEAEPILFLGEPGTGKTHLATALGVAAAHQGLRVRFVTAAALVTELVEARDAHELGRTVARYGRFDVLIVDELAYVPLSRSDAELLFRVLGERNERRPIIVTTYILDYSACSRRSHHAQPPNCSLRRAARPCQLGARPSGTSTTRRICTCAGRRRPRPSSWSCSRRIRSLRPGSGPASQFGRGNVSLSCSGGL